MATYGRDVYRWKWDYRVRQLFDLVNPAPGRGRAFTNANLNEYVRQDNIVTQDVATVARGQFTDALLEPKVDALARVLGQAAAVAGLPAIPRKPNRPADATRDLDNVYPAGSMPTPAALAAARARVGVVPAAPGPRGPVAVPGAPARPTGIPPVGPPPANPLPTDNIVLAANPPSLYEAIQDANIRTLARELSDPNYNPEQTFKVTINEPVDGAPGFPIVDLDVTPLQYAALKGLKGVVRYILNNTSSELTKKINGKSIKQAVIDYRKLDTDKNEIQYMFDITEAAIQDATEDFTGDKKLDGTYGNGAVGDINRILAKKIYEREYSDLKSPKPLSATAPKTSGTLIDDAKKKGKEDGSRGSPINPDYPTKTIQEQEAYGQEYDKAFATYQGEKDALLNEDSKFTILEGKLSVAYTDASAKPEHKSAVKKLYDAAYDANRGKTADLIKEAGYVGAYPPSDAVLSGNFFGFGPELSKLVGLNVPGQQPATDTYSKYKEGLIEFVGQLQSVLGQAKYAGYTDGLKKVAKYTTPGRISVKGKEYAIDFGKLNTRIESLPETTVVGGKPVLKETPEFTAAQGILTDLRRMRDDQNETLDAMSTYLRTESNGNANEKIKQLLNPIAVSQKGGSVESATRIRYGNPTPLRNPPIGIPISETGLDIYNRLSSIIETLRDKKDFETRLDAIDGSTLAATITSLEKDINDQYSLENPNFLTKLTNKISEATDVTKQAVGTAATAAQTAIAAVPGQIVTGLGSVTTKTQLYDLVQRTLSTLPKYDEKPIGTIPKGVSPDDPSLDNRVEPLKRVQAIYDREFERGTKEAMRRTGGTRRKTKKSNRLTKKQGSKK